MYTGSYRPAGPRKSRFFPLLCLGCGMIVLLLGTLLSVMFLFDVSLSFDENGVLTLAQHGEGLPSGGGEESLPTPTATSPGNSAPLTITSIPRPSPVIIVDDSGRQVLTLSEVYKKVVPSVTGVLSSYADGSGSGSGIVMSQDGYIITNHHVVDGATEIQVLLSDGREFSATLVGSDRLTDLAVLKIEATGLTPAEFGDSNQLEHGDDVSVIGNPLGMDLQNTLTNGIVSGINRDITLEDLSGEVTMNVLQTNCAVNPGNSGGPLINRYGQVVGIVSSKIMGDSYQAVEGLGFAIPINSAAPILNEIIEIGYVQGRPALGIHVNLNSVIDARTAQYYGIPTGLLIAEVNPKSDAYAQGVRANDILTHVNGQAVASLGEVNAIKNQFRAGDSITLTLYRKGQSFDLTVMLMEEGLMK